MLAKIDDAAYIAAISKNGVEPRSELREVVLNGSENTWNDRDYPVLCVLFLQTESSRD